MELTGNLLGIDVEKVKELPELHLLVERYLNAEELRFVESAEKKGCWLPFSPYGHAASPSPKRLVWICPLLFHYLISLHINVVKQSASMKRETG